MVEVTGTIGAIQKVNNNGREKKVLTLLGEIGKLFIEFQGKNMEKVWDKSIGQKVSVKVYFNGKTSGLGRNYNNIIGKSIKAI